MTRDEFMKHAEQEIEQAFRGQRNRMMNLVEQAWAEGKRNAEVEVFTEAGNELVNVIKKELFPKLPTTITTDKIYPTTLTGIPEPCKCSCWHENDYGMERCWGTKERDVCDCGGDKRKCNFNLYPEK